MEVRVGIQNVSREIVLESSETVEALAEIVSKAVTGGTELRLSDNKGRQVIVPASVLGYVEIGAEEQRRVGFGAL